MKAFVDKYSQERKSCGLRIASEVKDREYWAPLMAQFEMTKTHYYLYNVDV